MLEFKSQKSVNRLKR